MFKPTLAIAADFDKLVFPLIASPKIDGIRCVIDPERGAVTRKLLPIGNTYISEKLNSYALSFTDGEIVTYTNGKVDSFSTIQSKVMADDGECVFSFHVFDCFEAPTDSYNLRIERAGKKIGNCPIAQIHTYQTVDNFDQLMALVDNWIDRDGWEGGMARRPSAPYKYGKSTVNDACLLKIKRFIDSEARIKGFNEKMHNANEATKDELGRTKRSSSKAGLIPMDTLGSIECEWDNGVKFSLAGIDAEEGAKIWAIRQKLIDGLVNFKYQEIGPNGAPRFASYRGIRYDL